MLFEDIIRVDRLCNLVQIRVRETLREHLIDIILQISPRLVHWRPNIRLLLRELVQSVLILAHLHSFLLEAGMARG